MDKAYLPWKFAEFFSPHDAAMLIAGEAPSDDFPSCNFRPIMEAMEGAHYRAARELEARFIQGPNGCVRRKDDAARGFDGSCLPSALFEHYDASPDSEFSVAFNALMGLIDTHAALFLDRKFSASAIAAWLSANSFPTAYDFIMREPVTSAQATSPVPLNQPAIDLKARYAQIASDPDLRHRFLTELKEKMGSDEKVAQAIGLTRQAVGKHLRSSKSADQHKHDIFGRTAPIKR